jgi:HEAT repeat protein
LSWEDATTESMRFCFAAPAVGKPRAGAARREVKSPLLSARCRGHPIAQTEQISKLTEALKEEDWEVRISAAKSLGEIGNPAAVPGLIEALADPDRSMREMAAWALGRIRSTAAVPALSEVSRNDVNWYVRYSAINALARIGDAAALSALNAALKDKQWPVREAAAQALRAIQQAT